jgi:phage shock protein PspC (stress-responsive transcriptional regulator)
MNDPPEGTQEESKMQTEEQMGSAAQARKLTRNTSDKVIAGVASGLANYFGIDPVLTRIAFIVLTFVGGSGLLLYLLLWLFLPARSGAPSAGESVLRRTGDWSAWIGVALIVIAVASLVEGLSLWEPDVFWGVGLMGLGVYLLVRQEPTRETRAEPSETERPGSDLTAGPPPASAKTEQAGDAAKRPRSSLGPLTLGALLLVTGGAIIFDNLDVVEMTAARYLALALAIIGLGLVAGGWFGRSRGLIVLGLLLAPVVFVSGLIDVPFAGGAGERLWQPQTVSGIRDEYRLAAGKMTLDFADVDFAGETVDVEASVAMGELIVIVPDDVSVDVSGDVGAGELHAFGSEDEGLNLDLSTTSKDGGGGQLMLDVHAGLGSVKVQRANNF